MSAELSNLLRSLSPEQRDGLSWGDRGRGMGWQARHGETTTIGGGGPYSHPADAIRAVLGIAIPDAETAPLDPERRQD